MTAELTTRAATKTTANSFHNKLNEALAVRKTTTSQSLMPAVSQKAATAITRQGIGAARRNLVTLGSTAQSLDPRMAAFAKLLIPAKNITAAAPSPASVTTNISAANATSKAQASVAPVPMSPGDIVTSLLQKNAMPSPYANTSTPSMDPGVYIGGDYIKQSNLNFVLQQANHENQDRFDEYKNGVQNWAVGGMQGDPPAPPKYEAVDANGFGQWWNQYTANIGLKDAPSISTFVSNTTA